MVAEYSASESNSNSSGGSGCGQAQQPITRKVEQSPGRAAKSPELKHVRHKHRHRHRNKHSRRDASESDSSSYRISVLEARYPMPIPPTPPEHPPGVSPSQYADNRSETGSIEEAGLTFIPVYRDNLVYFVAISTHHMLSICYLYMYIYIYIYIYLYLNIYNAFYVI